MKNDSIQVNGNMIIDPDSELLYASSIGIGGDDEEVRLILFNKRLISNEGEMEIITESDTQIILNKTCARRLNQLLTQYLSEK